MRKITDKYNVTIRSKSLDLSDIAQKLKEMFEKSCVFELIDEGMDSLSISIVENELHVSYPCGEVYGYSFDYVCTVVGIFEDLKQAYNDIYIEGFVYEDETITYVSDGFIFWCDETDNTLNSTQEWQRCPICGNFITESGFYNSPQWEQGEGGIKCICSNKCAETYANSKEYYGINPNGTLDHLEELDEDKLDGVAVCVIGDLNNYNLEYAITDMGGSKSNRVSKKTTLVICNDLSAKSAQLEKAKSMNLPIMSEADFMNKYELDVLCYEDALKKYLTAQLNNE